jgi:hypothetical protein
MNASELQRAHAARIAEHDGEIAHRQEIELELKHAQRVSTAVRQGRDPYAPGFFGALVGPVDGELEASRRRASAAYAVEVIQPILARIKQADQRIEVLRVGAAEVWDQIETEFPAKAEEVYARAVNVARTEVAELDGALANLQSRVQRALTAKHDADRAAAQHAVACAAALAAGRPLPEPPAPAADKSLDDAVVAQARQMLLAQQPKAREKLRVAEDFQRAFRLRSERRHAEKLARETAEKARNTGVPLGLLVETLSREVRS